MDPRLFLLIRWSLFGTVLRRSSWARCGRHGTKRARELGMTRQPTLQGCCFTCFGRRFTTSGHTKQKDFVYHLWSLLSSLLQEVRRNIRSRPHTAVLHMLWGDKNDHKAPLVAPLVAPLCAVFRVCLGIISLTRPMWPLTRPRECKPSVFVLVVLGVPKKCLVTWPRGGIALGGIEPEAKS